MVTVAILDFQICEFLLADGVWRVQAHYCAKYRQNWSFHYGDIAIFRSFKNAATAILIFEITKILIF